MGIVARHILNKVPVSVSATDVIIFHQLQKRRDERTNPPLFILITAAPKMCNESGVAIFLRFASS